MSEDKTGLIYEPHVPLHLDVVREDPPADPAPADPPADPAPADPPADKQTLLSGDGKGDAPAGAPESYEDFTLPEGAKLEGDALEDFTSFAKDMNLSQEQAQKLLDRELSAQQTAEKRVADEAQAAIDQWAEAARSDKEIAGESGDKLKENLAVAQKALAAFGSDELKAMLDQSGMGNHPEAIRFFLRVGQAISDDKLVTGHGTPQQPKRFYANSSHAVS